MAALADLGAEGRRAMGARGRASAAANYSLPAMQRATLAIYAELIARARAGATRG
jgi:hypothetical protein